MSAERPLDHDEIEQRNLIELYAAGRLPSTEAERFEAHLVGCGECLDQVEAAERLRAALTAPGRSLLGPATDPPARASGPPAPVNPWRRRSRALALIAAALIAALLPLAFVLVRLERLEGELAALRGGRESSRREADELRARLESERAASSAGREREQKLTAQLAALSRPQTNVPLLFLGPVRGTSTTEPTHRLRLPDPPGWIVLALEIDGPAEASYEATLRGPKSPAPLLSEPGLHLNELGALTLSLHSATLEPGDYLVEARDETGSARARFRFRLEAPAP